MPENDESRAREAAKRVLAERQAAATAPIEAPGTQESPEDRQKRFAARPPDGETPDQRTNRFLEKARHAGYTMHAPMGGMRQGTEAPVDFEVDEGGNIVAPPPEPITWQNAGSEIPNRMGDAMSRMVGADKITPDQRLSNELSLSIAMNKVRMSAEKSLAHARQGILAPVYSPGIWDKSLRDLEAAHNQPDRSPDREPIQMQREFSNDQEKDAYIERIRQAQKNAAAAK